MCTLLSRFHVCVHVLIARLSTFLWFPPCRTRDVCLYDVYTAPWSAGTCGLPFSCGRDNVSLNLFVLAGMFADFATQGQGCQLKPRMYAHEGMLGSCNVFATMPCVNSFSSVTAYYVCSACFCAHLLSVRYAARLLYFSLVRSWSTYLYVSFVQVSPVFGL